MRHPRCPLVPILIAASLSTSSAWGIDALKEALTDLLLAERPGRPHGLVSKQAGVSTLTEGSLLLAAFNRQRCFRCLCCRMNGFTARKEESLIFSSDHAFVLKGTIPSMRPYGCLSMDVRALLPVLYWCLLDWVVWAVRKGLCV